MASFAAHGAGGGGGLERRTMSRRMCSSRRAAGAWGGVLCSLAGGETGGGIARRACSAGARPTHIRGLLAHASASSSHVCTLQSCCKARNSNISLKCHKIVFREKINVMLKMSLKCFKKNIKTDF